MSTTIFTPQFKAKTDAVVAKYETKRASLLEILRMVMEDYGHITIEAEEQVANYLGLAPIDVREVMTFYTLFYDKPRAKTRFNVCRTLSCYLLGANDIIKYFEEKLGIKAGQISEDGKFALQKVECLGACEHAPMLQLNDKEFVCNLTKQKVDELIKKNL